MNNPELDQYLNLIPDKLKLNALANLSGLTCDESWLIYFAVSYPVEYKRFREAIMQAPERNTKEPQ